MKAPFDLEKALAGHKLITRDGIPVEYFRHNATGIRGLDYAAKIPSGQQHWTREGRYNVGDDDHTLDLFLDIPDEEQQATPAAGEAPNPIPPVRLGRVRLASPANPIPRAPAMQADFWTMSVCVISTGHITEKDGQTMMYAEVRPGLTPSAEVPDFARADGMTHIFRIELTGDFPDPLDDLAPHYSPEFIALCRLAREAGYTHLRLDPDGMTLPGIPSFEW